MIPLKPNDHMYCGRLGHDAVHTAMRGYTAVVVGPIHYINVVLPAQLFARDKKEVNLLGGPAVYEVLRGGVSM